MLKDENIIVVGLQSLDSKIGSNCVNIAYELAKQNRVLYVNYAVDRSTLWKSSDDPLIIKRKNILKGKEKPLQKINNNLFNLYPKTVLESINQLKPDFLFDYLNRLNNKRFIQQIKKAIKELKLTDYIVFNDSDFYRSFYLKEILKPKAYLYYTRDNMIATSYYRKHGKRYETALMKKCDAVVANSVYLQSEAKKHNRESYYVGQGVDLSLFDPEKAYDMPVEIKKINTPVIGYIGALKSSRLNIDLIASVADSNPDYTFILVGPEDEVFKNSVLHSKVNIIFTGAKPQEQLPCYLKHFDIAFNPQIINELTIGNYPRKIDEYLAMGKPVIATRTKAMRVFDNYVYLADSLNDYNTLIHKALKEDSAEMQKKRIKFANSHTWENSVNMIYEVIERIIN